jgi:hypothetical protein
MRTELYYGSPEALSGPLINIIKKIASKVRAKKAAKAEATAAAMQAASEPAVIPPPAPAAGGIMSFLKRPDGSINPLAIAIPAAGLAAFMLLGKKKR